MSKRLSRSTDGEDSTGGVEQVAAAAEQKKVERRGRNPKSTTEPMTPKKARPSKSLQKQKRRHRHRHSGDKKHHSGSSSVSSSSSASSSSGSDGSRSSGSGSSSSSSSSSYSDDMDSSDVSSSSSSSSSSGSSGSNSGSSASSSSDSGSERKINKNRKKSRGGNRGSKNVPNSDEDGDDEQEVYCVCKKPYHHEFMFMCDRCQNWFHPKCVGLTKAEIKAHPDSQYYCTACRSALRPSSGSAAAATGAPQQQKTEKESPAATREQVSAAFTRLLELCASSRGGDSEVFSATARARARKLGTELEAALYERSGKNTAGAVYVARARFLLHNLDPKNTTLGKRVLSGELAPAVVALTDPRTLATKHIALPPSLTTPVAHVVPLPSVSPPEHKAL